MASANESFDVAPGPRPGVLLVDDAILSARLPSQQWNQRPHRRRLGRGHVGEVQERRIQVARCDEVVHASRFEPRAPRDQRHVGHLAIERARVRVAAVLEEVLAVIGGQEDERGLPATRRPGLVNDLGDEPLHVADLLVVMVHRRVTEIPIRVVVVRVVGIVEVDP